MRVTQTTLPQTRWQEIEKLWKDNRWLYVLAGILMGIISVPAIEQITGDLNTLIGNLVPETIGIIFTVLILNRVADNRAKDELKHQLLEDLKSTSIAPAVNALARLRRENWLNHKDFVGKDFQRANWEGAYIGRLSFEGANLNDINLKNASSFDGEKDQFLNFKDAYLDGANLQEANLRGAHLEGTNLRDTNLQEANLRDANLQDANLSGANLQNADLRDANLQRANLVLAHLEGTNLRYINLKEANLRGANLQDAKLLKGNLQDADLIGANLQSSDLRNINLEGAYLWRTLLEGAYLRDAHLDNVTWVMNSGRNPAILPDGTEWTPKQDLVRFTNPDHEEFEETLEKINVIRVEQGRDPIKII